MAEYVNIHREGQRAKWPTIPDNSHKAKSEDSVAGNNVHIGGTSLTEGPNLTRSGHVANEKPNATTTS